MNKQLGKESKINYSIKDLKIYKVQNWILRIYIIIYSIDPLYDHCLSNTILFYFNWIR